MRADALGVVAPWGQTVMSRRGRGRTRQGPGHLRLPRPRPACTPSPARRPARSAPPEPRPPRQGAPKRRQSSLVSLQTSHNPDHRSPRKILPSQGLDVHSQIGQSGIPPFLAGRRADEPGICVSRATVRRDVRIARVPAYLPRNAAFRASPGWQSIRNVAWKGCIWGQDGTIRRSAERDR